MTFEKTGVFLFEQKFYTVEYKCSNKVSSYIKLYIILYE